MVFARLFLSLSIVAAVPLTKVIFSDDVVKEYHTKCLDGTSAGYYIREVPGSQDWMFFMQGGGLCIFPWDCIARSKGVEGSSENWTDVYDVDVDHPDWYSHEILSDNPDLSPFAGFNVVYLPYCSGDTWVGKQKHRNVPLGGLYTHGHNILVAMLDQLFDGGAFKEGMKRVLVSGSSAGGIGVIHNADFFAQTITNKFGFADAVVKANPVSGLFFPSRPTAGVCLEQEYWLLGDNCPRIDIFESRWVNMMQNSWVHERCKTELGAAKCWDIGLLSRYVTTPMFFFQNRYDRFQMSNVMGCFDCSADVSKLKKRTQKYMSFFGEQTEETLKDLATNFNHSVFMPNCYAHTENNCMRSSLHIGDQTYKSALEDWFFNGAHHSHYDSCGELPCSQVCDCDSTTALV